MSDGSRILIFGLRTTDSDADVRVLMGPCGTPRLELCAMPGDELQAFAVVHLNPNREFASRVANRIGHCRRHGRRLQAWVPALPWI